MMSLFGCPIYVVGEYYYVGVDVSKEHNVTEIYLNKIIGIAGEDINKNDIIMIDDSGIINKVKGGNK